MVQAMNQICEHFVLIESGLRTFLVFSHVCLTIEPETGHSKTSAALAIHPNTQNSTKL